MPYSYDNLPDALDLFNEHEARLQMLEDKHPKCESCGKRIVTEQFFNVEGTFYCLDCMEDFKVDTEDYMED